MSIAEVWCSSATSGERPPPCSGFTLTSIDQWRAVLFGGRNGDQGRMNDIYIIDLQNMVATLKLIVKTGVVTKTQR